MLRWGGVRGGGGGGLQIYIKISEAKLPYNCVRIHSNEKTYNTQENDKDNDIQSIYLSVGKDAASEGSP